MSFYYLLIICGVITLIIMIMQTINSKKENDELSSKLNSIEFEYNSTKNSENQEDSNISKDLNVIKKELIEIEIKINKLNKHQENIQFNTSFMALVLFIYLLLKLVIMIISYNAAGSIINNM